MGCCISNVLHSENTFEPNLEKIEELNDTSLQLSSKKSLISNNPAPPSIVQIQIESPLPVLRLPEITHGDSIASWGDEILQEINNS